jgi:hypothetical protein
VSITIPSSIAIVTELPDIDEQAAPPIAPKKRVRAAPDKSGTELLDEVSAFLSRFVV